MIQIAEYVTFLLLKKNTLRYNDHFYANGDEEFERKLCEKLGIEEIHDGSVATVVDDLVYRLESLGFVETIKLPEIMGDGENDYEIKITEKYLNFIEEGGQLRY